jgi:hypothetical protein
MRKFILVIILFICVANARADLQMQTTNSIYPTAAANWNFAQSPDVQLQQVQIGNEILPLWNLHLSIRNGKTGKQILLAAPQIKTGKSTFTASQKAGDLAVTQQWESLSPQKDAVLWKIQFANNGAQEAWIETGLAGDVNTTSGLQFWDGYQSQKVTNKLIERSTPDMAFPATMIQSTSQHDALVIALHPDNDISWITTSLNPQSKKYFYGGRFVIPAGQKITLTYILYTLRPNFGELDAIDGYYQRFPSSFTARPNTDPRLTGFRGVNSSYVVRNVAALTNKEPDPRTLEGLAKLYAGWEWGYNPYKFSGDWFGRSEDWNLPLSQGDQASLETYQKDRSSFDLHDIEQFHKDRIALFKNADLRANNDLAFYILDFAQAELAQKNGWMKYSYGYFTPDVQSSGRIKHWVAPYDDTWHIFPWATPFGDSYKRDLPDVLKELNTSSFAIDVYADSAPYRGETTEYIPGWSYDEKGKFINSGIAYKHLVDFIHTLHKDNFSASVVANLSPWEKDPALKIADRKREIVNYSTAFAPDAYIVEGDVSNQIDYDQPNRLFPKRYLFGKKYISSVGGAYHDKIGERIPWRTMSPNQIRAAYSKYLKKRAMAYYQGGLLPNYDDARGIELITNEIPRLLDIESRGFTAAPASAGNSKLQRRRYGDGMGAAIVYSNPTNEAVQSQETLLNQYFSNNTDSVLLPFEDTNAKLLFSCNANSANTEFSLNVPSMENRIVLLPISLQLSKPQSLQGETSVNLQAHQQSYTANIKLGSATKVLVHIQPPRDFVFQKIDINGKKVQVDVTGDAKADLVSGDNQIKVLFASTQFLSTETQISDFNWKQFQIVVYGNNERLQAAAQIVADYATYYQKFTPAIITKNTFDDTSVTDPSVIISTDPKYHGVKIGEAKPKVLFITGNDDFDTQQLAWRLCRLLDRHSPLMPAATFTNPSTKGMLDRIGLMVNAKNSAVAKPITQKSLQPVPGEDKAPSGNNGDLSQLNFEKVLPLPRDGWKATASVIYTRDKTVSLEAALDGKDGTRWTGGRGKMGAWFMVDMGKLQEFNHVQLKSSYPYKYFPRHYKAELSDDGVTWRNPVEGEGAKDTEIFWPTLQKARYVRITLTEDQDEFWSIDEIFVYKNVLPKQENVAPALDTLPQLQIPDLQQKVILDGNLNEAAWQKAAVISQLLPLKDHPVTQPTQVKIFHDANNFYIGVICHEANMDKLWEPATQRDGAVWRGDDVEIYLSPGDHNGQLKYPYYQLLFSPSGVQTDLSLDADGRSDIKWNADWQVKTSKNKDYWSAEVRIPFKDLQGQNVNIWRANIGRMETPNGDTSTWAPMQRIFAQPALFGVWNLGKK